MPFDVQCSGCGRKFRAPDKLAGKRVKCPQCQTVLDVGMAPADAPRAKPASDSAVEPKATPSASAAAKKKRVPVAKPVEETAAVAAQEPEVWHMQTEDGQEYGPVTESELKSWVTEGRLDSTCQVLKDGWDQWQWADEVFPELTESSPPPGPEPEPESPFAGIGAPAAPTEVNPFAAPQAPTVTSVASAAAPAGEEAVVTPRLRRALADTKPWVTFLAILGFVLGGLGAIAPIIFMLLSVLAGNLQLMLLSLLMAVGPALYVVAAFYLMTYGNRIASFLRSSAGRDLEEAMVAQKSFWKLIGIVTAIVVAVYLLAAVMLFALGGAAAMMAHSAGSGG